MHYRKAKIEDIKCLVEIENLSFNYDQLNDRKFRHFIQKGHSDLIVQIQGKQITAYGLLLYRQGSSLARLYSIAVHKDFYGQGLGEKLMRELEFFVQKHNRSVIRLEVKVSNNNAIKLYKKIGYVQFSIKQAYYDNNEDALCLQKNLNIKLNIIN